MSHSSNAEDFIVEEWRAALAQAQVNEGDFHLITCPGAAVSGHAKAVSFDRGRILYGDDDEEEGGIVVQADKLAEANDGANVSRHRVAVYEDIDGEDEIERAYLAGVLRHEIEHGKQREAAREAFALIDVVKLACREFAAGDDARYRDLINVSPLEADANAAASAHVRTRYPHAIGELLAGSDHFLVDATDPPGDPKTLVQRTVEYLWQFQDICNDPSNLGGDLSFADILDNRVPGGGGGSRWRQLEQSGSG